MSIYHDEYGMDKPLTPFTEFAGGILDSYYLRIKEADQEVEHLTSRNRNLETENESLRAEVNRRTDQEKALTKDRDAWKIRADRLQGTIDTHATELAKRDKVIEQLAAWRVAVREALKDLPKDRGWLDRGTQPEGKWTGPEDQIRTVLHRIEDLTQEKDHEKP